MPTANIQGSVSSPAIYQAEWPKSLEPSLLGKIWNVVWNILCCTLLFPIGLTRLAIHITRCAIITGLVLPATYLHENRTIDADSRHTFKTPDGETLEGKFTPSSNDNEKVIIMCVGNGMHCDLAEKCHNTINSGASVFGFNLRGVGKSSGFPGTNGLSLQDSLTLDAYSAYEYVRNTLKIAPENIILHGLSLGGSYSARAALLIQEKYGEEAVKLINDSSFSTTAQVAIAHFKKAKEGAYGEELKSLTSWIFDPIAEIAIQFSTYIFGLQIDAAEAWNRLKTKSKCILTCIEDPVIPYSASLYVAIENANRCRQIWIQGRRHGSYDSSSLTALNQFITTL